MCEATRQNVLALAAKAVDRMATTGRPLEEFHGIALYNQARDELITSLDSFEPAVVALSDLPLVQERYGRDAANRLALQFIYELTRRLARPAFDEAAFDATWRAFIEELADPEWKFRGVANLRHFDGDRLLVELTDGVAIRGRNFQELATLGFSPEVLERLGEDWSGFGASSYVIVAEHRIAKSPDNFILMDASTAWLKAQRALGALRLLAPGDVGLGRMWAVRPARFNVGLGGVNAVGSAEDDAFGSRYVLTDELTQAHAGIYRALQHLEQHGYGRAAGNLNLALRSFMATYDRRPATPDSRLVDAVTALEAVLGSDTEIAFKLAFRVATLLAVSDADRVAVFQDVKAFYDVRSRVVHGGALRKTQRERLADVDRLRQHVRRLLRGLIRLATGVDHPYDKGFFRERLDAVLLDSAEREKLRKSMGLS